MAAVADRIEVNLSPAGVSGRAIGGRPSQQDAVLCLHHAESHTQLLVLADGMGGHGGGELASRLVLETALQWWTQGRWREEPGPVFLEGLCQHAHQRMLDHRDEAAGIMPHSTIVSLLIQEHFCYWAHVGDSRLYRYQNRKFLGHTQDHSLAQQQLQRGDAGSSTGADTSQQHLLLQGLGGNTAPLVEHGGMPSHAGHAFVLCSDGVWAYLSSEELGGYVHREPREAAMLEALNLALKRGGEQTDNASLIFATPQGMPRSASRGLNRWLAAMLPRR